MFISLTLIGFVGFGFGSSIFTETIHNNNNSLSYTQTLSVEHSLAGGLAQLAGIALNNTVVVVSISEPGISYSRAQYSETENILMDTINKRIFNIIHNRDVVRWADKHPGLIQYIICQKAYSRL
ncbi:unnamed protein product [Adineta steineri]|uniref:Uncharacterized protein n=1 Tax=Adineta steineri TaxID=433720 RepID=A0A819EK47_9BILA|nr:unnamed protein product [Adineta steineri]